MYVNYPFSVERLPGSPFEQFHFVPPKMQEQVIENGKLSSLFFLPPPPPQFCNLYTLIRNISLDFSQGIQSWTASLCFCIDHDELHYCNLFCLHIYVGNP